MVVRPVFVGKAGNRGLGMNFQRSFCIWRFEGFFEGAKLGGLLDPEPFLPSGGSYHGAKGCKAICASAAWGGFTWVLIRFCQNFFVRCGDITCRPWQSFENAATAWGEAHHPIPREDGGGATQLGGGGDHRGKKTQTEKKKKRRCFLPINTLCLSTTP